MLWARWRKQALGQKYLSLSRYLIHSISSGLKESLMLLCPPLNGKTPKRLSSVHPPLMHPLQQNISHFELATITLTFAFYVSLIPSVFCLPNLFVLPPYPPLIIPSPRTLPSLYKSPPLFFLLIKQTTITARFFTARTIRTTYRRWQIYWVCKRSRKNIAHLPGQQIKNRYAKIKGYKISYAAHAGKNVVTYERSSPPPSTCCSP